MSEPSYSQALEPSGRSPRAPQQLGLVLVDRGLIAAHRSHLLRRGPGRETRLVELGRDSAAVVKRYGGRGARGLFGAGAARREDRNLRALAALGLRVPAALGWWREGGAGVVAMEFVPHSMTLRELLSRAPPSERRERRAQLVELVTRLHGAGWYHRDLYLEHVLVSGADEQLVLIDLGRARHRRRPRRRWFVKDLAALLHSTPPEAPRAERLRFLAAYLDRRGVRGRRARRRWLRAVIAKERRMARHVPRAGESFPLPAEWRP